MLDSIKAHLTEAEAVALAIFEGITADQSGERLAPLDKAAYALFLKFDGQEFSLLGLEENRQQLYVSESINFNLSSLGDIPKVSNDQIPELTQRVMNLQRFFEIDASVRSVKEYMVALTKSGTDPSLLDTDTLILQAIEHYSLPHIAEYLRADKNALSKIKTLCQSSAVIPETNPTTSSKHTQALEAFDHTTAPVQ